MIAECQSREGYGHFQTLRFLQKFTAKTDYINGFKSRINGREINFFNWNDLEDLNDSEVVQNLSSQRGHFKHWDHNCEDDDANNASHYNMIITGSSKEVIPSTAFST